MFEKIVICLDGSKRSELILPYATEEAAHFRSRIILLQVFTPPIHGVVTGLGAAEQIQKETDEEEKRIANYLDGVAGPLREKGLNVECVIRQGNPGEEIVTYAHEKGVGLVAIATERRRGLVRATFGHTTDFILKEAHVPVLLVKP
jgi:nucleotide-binding universal stress UspA family protein